MLEMKAHLVKFIAIDESDVIYVDAEHISFGLL